MIVDVPAALDVNTNGSPAVGTICGCTLPPVVTFSSYGGTPPVITNRNVLPYSTVALFGVTTSAAGFAVGVGFGLCVGVGTGLGVGTGDGVGGGLGLAVGLGDCVGVGFGVAVGVGFGDAVGVGVTAGVGHTGAGVGVGTGDAVGVGWIGGGSKNVPLNVTELMNV